jgi:hypothetical protein
VERADFDTYIRRFNAEQPGGKATDLGIPR